MEVPKSSFEIFPMDDLRGLPRKCFCHIAIKTGKSVLIYQLPDCRIEIASRGFFFRFRIPSSLRASAIDGTYLATTGSIWLPNRCVV